MSDRLSFVHLTDLHFSALGTAEPTLLTDTTAALHASFAAIARLPTPPAFIAISGDLSEKGNEADYHALKALLDALAGPTPVVLALGNHDRRESFYTAFGDAAGADLSAPYDHDRVIADLHVITLDSSIPGRVGGGLDAGQIDWLRDRLAAHADCRKLLMVHHSPLFDAERTDAWDRLDAASTAALQQAIAGHDVVGILSGHVHREEVTNWHGVPVIVGLGHHAATNPLAPGEEIQLIDATGLTLCTLRACGLGVTFVPHPQDRRPLRTIPTAVIMAHDAAMRAAGAPGDVS